MTYCPSRRDGGITRKELLVRAELVIYGTTHAINAILTGSVAKTAFLTTEGHPDILLFREGGRTQPFNHRRPYPRGYVPRHLTWQVPERIDHHGNVLRPLDDDAAREIIAQLRENGVEAVAVCLLWSTANPEHELRVGAMLGEHLPGVAGTPRCAQLRPSASTAGAVDR